jgi:phospholipase/lecithinase/hemolysin
MKTRFRLLFIAGIAAVFSLVSAQAAQQCLVIGDGLTKEYEVEFPILYPNNSEAWDSRNWIEILHEHRNDWFDLGSFGAYYDVRITGHKHNWAFPGAKTQEIRDQLSSTNWFNKLWQSTLKSQLKSEVERVVIFAGGNDVDDYYGKIYNGSSPAQYTNRTRDNLIWIVDYVRAQRPSIPIVLVSVPHLGCAPDLKRIYPTNSIKTARVTAALNTLNAQLASLAQSRGVAFSSGVYSLTKSIITNKLMIGTLEINRGADADARPNYAFSGDGFHPGTSLQAKVAQSILNTFKTRWPSPAMPALSDTEVRSKVLQLTP